MQELAARDAGAANRMMARSSDDRAATNEPDIVVLRGGRLYLQTTTTGFLFFAPLEANGQIGPVERELRVAID